jgi:hypothetical protein
LNENKLWKQFVDVKYNIENPNFFSCIPNDASPFWKGVLWAAKDAKIGYQWKVGDGKKIKFWEDHWFGTCSLAIQYLDVYVLVNEQNKTIAELWDGETLIVTSRRCFHYELMVHWFEILHIAQSIHINNESDALIWMWEANGIYTVKSMYAVVNFRGIKTVDIHGVWKIKIPPKIHVFLWLLAHNKLLTRDNLSKRKNVDDLTCVFYNEIESCHHLFFDCMVASNLWKEVRHVLGFQPSFKNSNDVSALWGDNKKDTFVICFMVLSREVSGLPEIT